MAQAVTDYTPTRRNILAGLAAAAAFSASAEEAAAATDAALLAACAEFHRIDALVRNPPGLEDGEIFALDDAWMAQIRTLKRMHPATENGRKAKASVAFEVAHGLADAYYNPDWWEHSSDMEALVLGTLAHMAGRI